MRRTIPVIALILLSSVVSLHAQIGFGITDADRAEFAAHRTALLKGAGEDLVVIFGAYERADNLRWRQDNRFYYLTGVEIPFAALLLDGKTQEEILFLAPARSGTAALFEGGTLGPGDEAAKLFGIADTRPLQDLEKEVRARFNGRHVVRTVLQPEENIAGSNDVGWGAKRAADAYPWSRDSGREARVSAWLQGLQEGLAVSDICPVLDEMRRVKSDWEIARIEEATRIAGEGHIAAMRATAPGTMEYAIEAAASGSFIAAGALYPAYVAIVGSGPNNCVLHYSLSSRQANEGELVLMDYAPDWRYYCSDITRTWPVNGHFSDAQKRAYNDCLAVQTTLIKAIKPGMTFAQINALYRGEFQKRGYTKEVLHGVSHFIGLSVHDVGSTQKPLEPGCVITIEPGIYFLDSGWGIRIEDIVLVTKDGNRVLSPEIPRTVEEIETVMATAGNGGKGGTQ